MKSKNIFYKFFSTILSPNFYRFLSLNIYRGFNRYLSLKNLRLKYPGVIIQDDILISNPERIEIGEATIIEKGCNLFCGYPPNEGSISLGKKVIIGYNSSVYAGAGNINIENNVDIGLNCVLTTQSRNLYQDPVQERANFEHVYGEIVIGEGTLVASNVTILAGTTLGKYCNIVAGSVVQGNYPNHTTLAGNPARPLPRASFN
jgi:acetyltransferase-like isoleucine patch superfamily enzyme